MGWARHPDHAAHLYVLGYRRAAEVLQAEVVRSSSEGLVFPLLFLWRQHLELYVKRLIELARTVHDAEARTPFGHRLPDLWRELRGLMQLEELSDDVRAALDATDQVMKDLEAVDPNSTHSRYAEGRSGKDQVMSLAGLPEHFDPQHFGAVLSKTSDFFDCVDIEYSSRLDAMAEAMASTT